MEARVKLIAAEGTLQKAKDAVAERDAWANEGELPKSPAFSPDVQQYLNARRTASTQLVASYREAIANYTKELKLQQATSIEEEKEAFIAKEKVVLEANRDKQADPASSQDATKGIKKEATKNKEASKEYLADFVQKLHESIGEILQTEDTSAKRDKAYRTLLNRLDAELQLKQISLHYPIEDIENDYWDAYSVRCRVPEEIQGIGDIRYINSWNLKLSDNDATKISSGDTLVVSGVGRIAAGYLGQAKQPNTLGVIEVEYDSGRGSVKQSIYLQNYGIRVIAKDSDGKETVIPIKTQNASRKTSSRSSRSN